MVAHGEKEGLGGDQDQGSLSLMEGQEQEEEKEEEMIYVKEGGGCFYSTNL